MCETASARQLKQASLLSLNRSCVTRIQGQPCIFYGKKFTKYYKHYKNYYENKKENFLYEDNYAVAPDDAHDG